MMMYSRLFDMRGRNIMINVVALWNPKQALLREIIQKPDNFDEAIKLCLEMHSLIHTSEMSGINIKTLEDELWNGLDEFSFRTMPTIKDTTIAWNIWHLTRIEDITANILIADDTQVITRDHWLDKMNVTVCDTGNAMTDEEIEALSSAIDMNELRSYRIAVGRKTKEIIEQLQVNDLKRKMEPARLQRIFDEGGVLKVEGSKWLVEFWSKKTIAGILLMPITRHQIVHINDSLKLKEKCKRKISKLV